MSESVLREKSKAFARQIVFLCREMRKKTVEYVLVNQLLKSGTSIGANLHEAQYAQGTKDFISKLEIALKECNETEYWLELLYETNSITGEQFEKLRTECINMRRMMVASVRTIKEKL